MLADAPALLRLAEATERSLLGEHSIPVARLLELALDWTASASQKTEIQGTLPAVNLTGDGQVVSQSLSKGMENKSPQGPQRIGANAPDSSVTLREQVRTDIASAFGVAPGLLFAASGSAQSTRELKSLWARGRVLPVLDTLSAELARVFGTEVSFTLPLLDAEREDADARNRQRRAVAIGALIGRGLSRDDAVSLYDQ